MDVVRANYSEFPVTQPLSENLDLPQAAHLRLSETIYLSPQPRAELWITRGDAKSLQSVLQQTVDPTTDVDAHVIDRHVVFVDWIPADSGEWKPYVVCAGSAGGYDVFWPTGHTVLKASYDYQWGAAFAWNSLVVVPTTGGISILDLNGTADEVHYEFKRMPGVAPIVPQALTDLQGVIAWTPWDPRNSASGDAARFVNGKWSTLTRENGWPGKLVHVVPLLDGSALQLLATDGGAIRLAVTTLEKVEVNPTKIAALVDQLNDLQEEKRVDAYEQLTRYGPGIWPILEKLAPDQPPEAADRLEQLLRDKNEPTLGGRKLLGIQTLAVADRLSDGGVIFYAPDGVSIPNPGGETEIQVPAWISVRPGEPIALLPDALTADLKPDASRIWAIGDEWVVYSELRGMQRFVGNGFVDLLRNDEAAFNELIGIDHRGRWLFGHHSGAQVGAEDRNSTLIIDPTLPDPTPRLPAWTFTTADSVGWDRNEWPVVKRGAAYALMEREWHPMGPNDQIFSRSADAADEQQAAKKPSTSPSTAPTAQITEHCLLTDPQRRRYYDGKSKLLVVDADGNQTIWTLPAAANGRVTPHLVRTADGRLYLFNEAGRILRIRPTPRSSQPFEVEATFTRDIPNNGDLTRFWIDPAGRIDVEWDNKLTILFPAGYIPRTIAEKMQSTPTASLNQHRAPETKYPVGVGETYGVRREEPVEKFSISRPRL